ncbi:glycoside hydrolase family 5 protein [Lachnospiraceae bacterium ZAX-1]
MKIKMSYRCFYAIMPIAAGMILLVAVSCLQKKEERLLPADMRVGWNLGNTLDAHFSGNRNYIDLDQETFWGNPETTAKIIAKVDDAGFDTIRIPVTWYEHMDSSFQIDAAWLDRVQQVVDFAIECNLYVILNAHHDTWYTPSEENSGLAETMICVVWKQIAERFAQYDDRLLFENMNEPRLIGTRYEWTQGTPQARETVNKLNAAFVKTVRQASGGNSERYLILPTYGASLETEALEAFQLQKADKVIVSVHFYRPYWFAQEVGGDADKCKWNARTQENTLEIDRIFADLGRIFIDKGIPVIITEFGAIDKGNEADRAAWAHYIVGKAKRQNIPCIWWDTGGKPENTESFFLMDRYSLTWQFPQIVKALTGKNVEK